MTNGIFNVPVPKNEPIFAYSPGSPEKKTLKEKIAELKGKEIPASIAASLVLIGGFVMRVVFVEAGQISTWLNY